MLKFYEEADQKETTGRIESVVELEDNYLAFCTSNLIKIYIYNPSNDWQMYDEYMEIKDDKKDKNMHNLIYTKGKNLLLQSEIGLDIYDINLKDKKYILLQFIDINLGKCIVNLSNNNIVVNSGSKLIIFQKIDNINKDKLYEISSTIKLGKGKIDCIIQINKDEICASSFEDKLITFLEIKTLKSISQISCCVSGDRSSLNMINKNIMLAINILGLCVSLININTHQLIKNIDFKIFSINKILHFSENIFLFAIQKDEEYEDEIEEKYDFVYIKKLLFDEEKNTFDIMGGEINTYQVDGLNEFIILKNKNFVTCSQERNCFGQWGGDGMMKIFKSKMNEEDLEKLCKNVFDEVDINKTGKINYEQFKKIFSLITQKFDIPDCPEEVLVNFFSESKESSDQMIFKKFKKIVNLAIKFF